MGRKKRQLLYGLNGASADETNEKQRPTDLANGKKEFVSDEDPVFSGRNPQRRLSQEEESLLAEVMAAFDAGVLNRLSDREHECFVAVMISGDGYDQVAKRLRITRRVVEGYVNRAGAKIRQFIEEQYGI